MQTRITPPIRNLISTNVPLSRTIWCALAVTAVLVTACPPPGGGGNTPPEVTLAFEQATVRKSKLLVSTNGNADQTFTNTLRANGTAPAAGATYRISAPAGYSGPITVGADGAVRFGKAAYDKVNTDGPQTVTIEAVYQGKTASYTFTVTDHFSPRHYHSSVVLGNDIYVIGGTTQNAVGTLPEIKSNEVWRSSDGGLTWDQVADAAKRFSPARNSHSSVVLGEDIYVIAGSSTTNQRDVWKSSDRGVSWNRATANAGFSARYLATAGVLNEAIYLMGGFRGTGAYLNDVWRSSDGVTWTEVTNTTAARFPRRLDAASVVLPGSGAGGADELYYIGGFVATATTPQNVYKSGDGTTWNQLTPVPGFANRRYNHTAVVLGGDIYLIAGQEGSTPKRDVWRSQDKGVTWSRITATAGFGVRTQHSSVVHGGTMYLIGGSTGSATELRNDVWRSTDGVTWVNVHANP